MKGKPMNQWIKQKIIVILEIVTLLMIIKLIIGN